jgi:hypothetical protein
MDYISRINASGNTIGESNLNSTAKFIESHFADDPSYVVVKINGEDVGVRITELSPVIRGNMSLQFTRKIMQLKPLTVFDIGTIVIINGENWLISDFNDNRLYPQARIDKCNSSIVINTPTENVVGENPYTHEPIIEMIAGTDIVYPCIVVKILTNESLNQPINIDRDTVLVTLPFFDFKEKEIEVYGEKYAVKSVDKTKSMNGKGLLIILGERGV